MKYKVGDKVRIKSIDWYNSTRDINGWIDLNGFKFNPDMKKFCGKTFTIKDVWLEGYYEFKGNEYCWTDDMIEGFVEEKTDDCEKCGLIRNSTRCLFTDNCPYNKPNNVIEIPEGYIFKDENGNVINAIKIVLEKKKPVYPTTYEECYVTLEYIPHTDDVIGYKWNILQSLQKLLICRDAYWKIAGKEMGLGKPWEPEYKTLVDNTYFTIHAFNGEIVKSATSHRNAILAFPTEEIRDAFYENFKDLIEICKELL